MEPVIDPITGQPVVVPQTISIPKDEWEGIKTRLDTFERSGGGGQFQQPQYTPPSTPSYQDEIVKLEKQIESLDTQIDTLADEGKPTASLRKQQRDLEKQVTRLQIKNEDIDPTINAGIGVIDQISAEMSRGKMPYYDIVKKDVEASLAQLPPSQRMNPQVRQAAYQLAVGQNVGKILAAQKEEVLRSAAQDPNLTPGASNGRNGAKSDPSTPKPKDILGKEAIQAIKAKGLTVDQEYQRRGYANWEDYWNKIGKSYFGDNNNED